MLNCLHVTPSRGLHSCDDVCCEVSSGCVSSDWRLLPPSNACSHGRDHRRKVVGRYFMRVRESPRAPPQRQQLDGPAMHCASWLVRAPGVQLCCFLRCAAWQELNFPARARLRSDKGTACVQTKSKRRGVNQPLPVCARGALAARRRLEPADHTACGGRECGGVPSGSCGS